MEQRQNTRQAMEEAANRPLDFEPKARAQYVRDMIKKVEDMMREGKDSEEIKAEIPAFVKGYKNLFEMLTKPGGYDKKSLQVMLAMLDQMGNGNLTQHQASVIVGQKLADTYIKPSIN